MPGVGSAGVAPLRPPYGLRSVRHTPTCEGRYVSRETGTRRGLPVSRETRRLTDPQAFPDPVSRETRYSRYPQSPPNHGVGRPLRVTA